MSRPWNPGQEPDSFNLRWHSVANPATSSLDIMSSPDPLNDPATPTVPEHVPSSATRRVTRSQRSQRFVSLGSPQKPSYMDEENIDPGFALGAPIDSDTPEPDDRPSSAGSRATSRQLFPSSSRPPSRQQPRATTTVVPLNDSIEDDPIAVDDAPITPRRRGRLRSSNGTPIPGTKRRAGTPIRKTPRRARETPSEASEQGSQATPTPKRRARAQLEVQATPTPTPEPQPQPQSQTQREATPQNREASVSEADSQATPTPRRSARRTPKRTAAPSSDLGLDSERDLGSTRRSTRRRRQALAPKDLVELAESAVITDEVPASDDGLDLVNTAADPPSVRSTRAQNTREASEPGSDIWMATLSNEATPRPSTRSSARNRIQSSSVTPRRSARATKSPYKEPMPAPSPTPAVVEEPDQDPEPEPQLEYEEDQQSQTYDAGYGYLAPADSDVSSADDLADAPVATRDMDTIAQGEDFSMIFMDTIPAMNASLNQSANPTTYSDLGDETNMIINNTLESLRQDVDEEEEDDEELPDLVDHPSPESEEEAEVPTPTSQEKRQSSAPVPQPSSSPSRRSSVRPSPARLASSQRSTARPSPIKQLNGQSPQLSYSPRKNASPSPLRQRLLKSRAAGGDNSPIASPDRRRSTLGPSDRSLANAPGNDESMTYDDSFSEIPQDILAAATPRRPGTTFVEETEEEELEEDQEEEEIGMDQLVYAADRSQVQPVMEQFENEVAESIEEDDQLDAEEDLRGEEEPDVEEDLEDELAQDMVDAEADIADIQDELAAEQEEDFAEQGLEEADQYEMDEAEDEEAQYDDAEDAEDQLASNASAGRSEASRLPTPPDDVPLPTPAPATVLVTAPSSSRGPDSLQQPRFQSNITSPLQSMNITNSAPDYEMAEPTPMSQQRQSASAERTASSITPVNQISSPAREPQSVTQEQLVEKGARPLLSPIVRAGRMLQSVTSDPPSPDDRDRQLGSPFRSSASKDSARGSKDGFTGHWMSKSPTRAIGLNQQLFLQRESPKRISPGNRFTSAAAQDTPRANTSVPSFRITSPARQTPAAAAAPSSTRLSPSSDGVMSWIMREGPISPKLRGDNSLREAYAAAGSNRGVTPQPAPALDDEEDVSDSAESESEVHEAVEAVTAAPAQADDETDIWEFEAQRAPATPRSTRQQPFGKRTTPGTARRRAAIPKAWATQQDDAATPRAAAPVSTTPAAQSNVDYPKLPDLPEPEPLAEEGEGYSMLEKRRAAEEAAKGESSAVKNSRFDLSAFFSSPAAIPGMLAEKFFPGKTQADAANSKPSAALPTTSMFPADDGTPVRPNPPSAKRRRQVGFGNNTREESPGSPEEPTLPVISQKQNFTPRPRQTSQTFYQPNSAAAQSTAATPPRMQLSHADIRRWQQEMSSASEDSPDFVRPLLRPLPPKNASPSKSILRSPLKPRTPGRVVEFTSSVLSPMEQAKARHERRTSNASASSGFNSFIQQHQQQHDDHELQQDEPEQLEQIYNKENHDSDISMSDAPPVQRKTVPVPVSQTAWTRQHWLFLDWLIRQRRLSPFEVEYDRSADKYLGKTVRSHGEAMTLERWHLDCVDAFKAEVGGWDEGVLVKRLFALILGEEKRGSGEDGQPALLFH